MTPDWGHNIPPFPPEKEQTVVMPKTTPHATDLDYELAMLTEPLTPDALDVLSDVIDARDAIRDLTALINHMQNLLETGAAPYATREQFAVDLEQATDTLRHHISAILGAEQAIY